MENKNNKIHEFDAMFSTDEIRLLKILSFFAEPDDRKFLILLIKIMEFKNCIDGLHNSGSNSSEGNKCRENSMTMEELFTELKDILPKEQSEMMEQFMSMKEMLNMADMLSSQSDDENELLDILLNSAMKGENNNE